MYAFVNPWERDLKPASGFDLALTELKQGDRELFLVECNSQRGAEVLKEIGHTPATKEIREQARVALQTARKRIGRKLESYGLRRRSQITSNTPNGNGWPRGGMRQLRPGAYLLCITFEDTSEIDGSRAERWRRWDSCYTLSHSYIHGGSVRQSAKSRHRQWVTHKLSPPGKTSLARPAASAVAAALHGARWEST